MQAAFLRIRSYWALSATTSITSARSVCLSTGNHLHLQWLTKDFHLILYFYINIHQHAYQEVSTVTVALAHSQIISFCCYKYLLNHRTQLNGHRSCHRGCSEWFFFKYLVTHFSTDSHNVLCSHMMSCFFRILHFSLLSVLFSVAWLYQKSGK